MTCYHCGTTEGVDVYINHVDNAAEIALCMACLMSPYMKSEVPPEASAEPQGAEHEPVGV